jgi:hypothetical protein
MRPDDIIKLLRASPFEPFRIHLLDGKTYDIRHPELAIVSIATLVVGVPGANLLQPAQDYHIVSLRAISRIEPLAVTNPSAN